MSVKINNSTINNNSTTNAGGVKSGSVNASAGTDAAVSFQSVLKGARLEDFNGTMRELLDVVRNRGTDFLHCPDEKTLESYRQSVKYFLNRLKDEFLSLKQEFGTKSDGEKVLNYLVDTADNQAEAMTQEAFGQDQALELLNSLDDIRGMVLDVIG